MQWPVNCPKCGSDKISFEMRNWSSEDPLPPREAYGTWWICIKCGYAWEADMPGIFDVWDKEDL